MPQKFTEDDCHRARDVIRRRKEFETITRPVIEWLNANCHPHVMVVIEPTSAVLSEGTIAFTTNDYLRD